MESTSRELRGLAMAKGAIGRRGNPDVSIQRMNKLTYKVKSQSDPSKWYTVIRAYGSNIGEREKTHWTCDCPDFTFRHVDCKHVHAVIFSKLLRKKVYQDTLLQTPINQHILNEGKELGKILCQRCGSENYKKHGVRHNKKAGDIQRYLCRDCKYVFIVNPAFENAKASAKTISNAIDLYFKGMSLRKISDHLKTGNVIIHNTSVCRWIRKFNKVVQPYVDAFVPTQVGGVYHVDEMLLHVRKEYNDTNMTLDNKENHTHRLFNNHYSWLWNLMDSSTRFWICSRISQTRGSDIAREVFKEMKGRAPIPKAIVHDGLPTYTEAFNKELFLRRTPRVKDVRSVSVRGQGLNSRVERLNGSVRERECVMRGMNTAESAQELLNALRIHYNFIRGNQAIGGQTPAEAAGIDLNLGENKTESLMRQAAVHAKDSEKEPLVKGLGIRIMKVNILNEKDCIKVRPKSWLDKKDWREIHDILGVQGFNWLANGKDSCWIKINAS